MSSSIITLLTDFGQKDGFVGTMKGVILSINPDVKIVDLTHTIEPYNISSAAFLLNNSYKFFPKGTIHVVVVDPGVGGNRQILCVSAFEHFFIAPDNGVLKYVFNECADFTVIEVSNSQYFLPHVSQTFHGRDIFAPVAAHLAKGVDIFEFGNTIYNFEMGNLPVLEESENKVKGEIIYIDKFGNLITNIPFKTLKKRERKNPKLFLNNYLIANFVDSYCQGSRDEPVALIGSSGNLEIAINLGSAKESFNSAVGDEVIISF